MIILSARNIGRLVYDNARFYCIDGDKLKIAVIFTRNIGYIVISCWLWHRRSPIAEEALMKADIIAAAERRRRYRAAHRFTLRFECRRRVRLFQLANHIVSQTIVSAVAFYLGPCKRAVSRDIAHQRFFG